MIKIPQLKGFNYTKYPTYKEFSDTLNIEGWERYDLGVCSDGVNHVYGFSYGDLSKPTIYIQGTIHGKHEWRCGHWLKRFMEIINSPNGLPQAEMIYKIRTRFSFYIIPCLNPFGYENDKYRNANGVNLNRNFPPYWEDYETPQHVVDAGYPNEEGPAPFSEVETQMVRDVVMEHKPSLFIDCHTWGGHEGSNLQVTDSSHKYLPHLRDANDSLGLTINRNDLNFDKLTDLYPMSAEWGGQQTDKLGRPTMSFAFEPGSEESESEQARIGINAMLILSWYLYKWFEDGSFGVY